MRLVAAETEAGKRTDAWVATAFAVSRSRAVALLKAGTLTLNGKPAAPDHKVHADDVLEGELPAQVETTLAPSKGKVPIVFQDKDLFVVNKPAGLAVHPGAGLPDGTLVNVLVGMKIPLAPAGGNIRPGVVHRLDKDTSGLLVLAKSDRAFWKLVEMVAGHELEREYLAIVVGRPSQVTGTIDAAIDRDIRHREKFTVVQQGGRHAVTHYTIERALKGPRPIAGRGGATEGRSSLLRLTLETGRTHQIRVHCKAMGWPILGDVQYGGSRVETSLMKRQALHATKLTFRHPITGKTVATEAPLPRDMAAAVKALALPALRGAPKRR